MISTIDIILPVYNPHKGWEQDLLENYEDLLRKLNDDVITNLIIVNDGSDIDLNSSIDYIVSKHPRTIYKNCSQNHGKGQALRTGIKLSQSDFILYTDYDFPYTTESMLSMMNAIIKNEGDLIIPYRTDSYYKQIKNSRQFISKSLKTLNKLLLDLPVSDTQGGLKIFKKSIAPIFISTKTNRYLIDIEFIRDVHRKKLLIKTVGVELRDGIQLSKPSNMKLFSELKAYIKILID